jgi:hypothetical protein
MKSFLEGYRIIKPQNTRSKEKALRTSRSGSGGKMQKGLRITLTTDGRPPTAVLALEDTGVIHNFTKERLLTWDKDKLLIRCDRRS